MERGRIPLLSFHHLEELLLLEDEAIVRARVEFIQNLPLLAWVGSQSPGGVGSIVQVLAAEVVAVSEGHHSPASIRDRARTLFLKTGTGTEAIGSDVWVWEAIRPALRSRVGKADMTAVVSPIQFLDMNRTIGELSKGTVRSPAQARAQLSRIRGEVFREAMQSNGGDEKDAEALAMDFVDRASQMMPLTGKSVRDVLVAGLAIQGVDEAEIRDECLLADLSRLGDFRSQLRVVASATGLPFDELKKIPIDLLPSRIVSDALIKHGQLRKKRPGSDLNDRFLGVLAAYCDVLYVDKRTAEDFRRARHKERRLDELIGEIVKSPDFESLLG